MVTPMEESSKCKSLGQTVLDIINGCIVFMWLCVEYLSLW